MRIAWLKPEDHRHVEGEEFDHALMWGMDHATLKEFHFLGAAIPGFSTLGDFVREIAPDVSSEMVMEFTEMSNKRNEAGSLHPLLPISVVPRHFFDNVEEISNPVKLREFRDHINDFIQANNTLIKSQKILVDFRNQTTDSMQPLLDLTVETFQSLPLDEQPDELALIDNAPEGAYP